MLRRCVAVLGALALAAPAAAQAAPDVLPDLVQVAPSQVRAAYDTTAGWGVTFAARTRNAGAGELRVEASRATSDVPLAARQVLAGSGREVPLPALQYVTGNHAHFHLVDFARYELLRADGTPLARDRKTGFCLTPVVGTPLDPTDCRKGRPDALSVVMGLPPGTTDLYGPELDGQVVDLPAGLQPGTYALRQTANPDGALAEVRRDNNDAQVPVELRRTADGGWEACAPACPVPDGATPGEPPTPAPVPAPPAPGPGLPGPAPVTAAPLPRLGLPAAARAARRSVRGARRARCTALSRLRARCVVHTRRRAVRVVVTRRTVRGEVVLRVRRERTTARAASAAALLCTFG